jgi:single-stranded DNA-binding protein
MACDNGKDRAATFVNVSVFGRRGDVIMQYFTKGNRIVAHVQNLEVSGYIDGNGEAKASMNAVLSAVDFVETRADQAAQAPAYQQQPTAAAPAPSYTQPAVPYQQPAPQQGQLPGMPQAPVGVPWAR